ncbi:FAD dependent oxidoreductase [Scheffersomyces amazonensis]|uniref:FAD dependent oxidoreductase n=1 Tax=Scheffersomyces amazonensis TaxID=1078765 RepID=UPI00315C73AF
MLARIIKPRKLSCHFQLASRNYSDFSHVVIGGGVVGTAIASELQKVSGNSVLLVEKNQGLGLETTSRNSEVIHAGLYYPPNSLKAQLCIKGKEKIYQAWDSDPNFKSQVPLRKCGKWVVAQSESEIEYLEKLSKNATDLKVPVSMISASMAAKKYPLIRAEAGALESHTTGIISAHDLTHYYQSVFEINEGTVSLNTTLKDIQFNQGVPNYTLNLFDDENGEFEIQADNVINAAGLYAAEISNLLLPNKISPYFAKGTYFSFEPETPISSSKITEVLIYPCPNPNASSLGTHLTFDLGGQLRFGPDLEWLDIERAEQIDYTPSSDNLQAAYEAIKTYLPLITPQALHPTYSGVRPKVVSEIENKKAFADFIIRDEKNQGFAGFVNLLGIESPGLTASWSIADYVRDIYH